jgi:peroxisomal enoyl-CoA hydratase 2
VNVERFPVEVGAIRVWAHAIGDDNPVYVDESAASAVGLNGIAAPPTFVQAAAHWAVGSPAGEDGRLHAEQHFEYHRPLIAGDVLTVRTVTGDSWQKRGRRGGTLHFEETITEYRDRSAELVVTVRSVTVLTEHVPTRGAVVATDATPAPPAVLPAVLPPAPSGPAVQRVVVEDLKRTQIVQYAGASGDFNPVHTDEIYAVRVAGFPSVFAHGMLTMALTGKLLTDVVGIEQLVRFGGRFLAQVWPGDSLTTHLDQAVGTLDSTTALALHTFNQHGVEVFAATATARCAAHAIPAALPHPPRAP